jgi:hypothetical protein
MFVNGQCNFRRQSWDKKEAEDVLKYKDRTTEIQLMWNVKTTAISVTTGAIGTVSKSFRKYLSNTPGKHDI